MNYIDIKPVLSIAGSDSFGGAGIQADIKTIIANGCYAMTAITALTAQNTMGVQGICETKPCFLEQQLGSIFEDITPCAIKIGMVSSKELIEVIVNILHKYNTKNVVVDPVMVSTSGSKLLEDSAIDTLVHKLFPIATLITPNIPEAELLSGVAIKNKDDMIKVASNLAKQYGISVLLKGGHSINDANDLLVSYDSRNGICCTWFEGERIDNPNTHGTGCTLSSAIASNLAKGYSLEEGVKRSKEYISNALKHAINLGHGSGPLNHGWEMTLINNEK